ncbi:DUF1735 and LamG domain-containing protein [Bacteroides sp. AN502(2024)]|uniref:DUF1735 and LamG domain-containing protein n=1 Tax=Bacteroides sp. AN502(2024) TaxID=3160599 RepID=UPI003515EBE4
MKKSFYLATLLFLAGCQNELYKNPLDDFKSEQGAYIKGSTLLQTFVEEGKEIEVNGLQVALAVQDAGEVKVKLEAGNQSQLDAYNTKNGTAYIMLPENMYEVSRELSFKPQFTLVDVPILLKNVKFSLDGNYALPIRIAGGDVNIIQEQEEALLVLEQRVNTKALRVSTNGSGSGSEDETMFPNDFKVDQWTMEVMINRASYRSNNRSICGTKLVANSDSNDEIYVRFGDVTIEPNQLQIKTGRSQIDVPADKFSAKPNVWYMLTFVYDGKKNSIYVNGELVAEREIRTGPYGLIGFWIGGSNELIREVRFWKVARTPQEIASNVWKMVNPDDDGLLLYYPLNGKKRDTATGEIMKDEAKLWDWSKNGKHLLMKSGYTFDNNNDDGFIFPPVEAN